MKISFEGGVDVAAALRALGEAPEIERAGRDALMVAATPIAERARAEAPDDPATATAHLKGSVKAAPLGKARSREAITVQVGIDAEVDPPRIVARKSGRGTYRDPGVAGVAPIIEFGRDGVPADPFMRRAMDAELPAAPQRVADALGPAIFEAAARIGRRAARKRK